MIQDVLVQVLYVIDKTQLGKITCMWTDFFSVALVYPYGEKRRENNVCNYLYQEPVFNMSLVMSSCFTMTVILMYKL